MLIKNNLMFYLMLTLCYLALNAHAAKVALNIKNSSSSNLPTAVGKTTTTQIKSASITAANSAAIKENDAADDDDDDDDDDEGVNANGNTNTKNNTDDADDDDDAVGDDDIADGVNAAIDNELKSEVQAGNEVSTVGIWTVVRGLWSWIKNDIKESIFGEDRAVESRTFGRIRRLQMAIIPLMFKFGILTAMVAFLVVLGMKTIFLLKVLLVLNIIAILGKFLTLKSSLFSHVEQQQHYSPPTWHYTGGWATTPVVSGGGGGGIGGGGDHHQHPSKEIHLHIHGAQAQPQVSAHSYTSYGSEPQQHWERRNDPYVAYDPAYQAETAVLENQLNTELNNELKIAEPVVFTPTKYPVNHRQF